MIAINTGNGRGDLDETPTFAPGQLVRHRRYGYRGVVVERDEHCRADEKWYQNNQTQPDRNQPWYHVLVHGTTSCTYAAAQNLLEDCSPMPIDHPWVAHFFSEFMNGRYIRNDEPWPS